MYDGLGDLEDHVDYFEFMLPYQNIEDKVKCKNFPLTFTKATLAWYMALKPNTITSWS